LSFVAPFPSPTLSAPQGALHTYTQSLQDELENLKRKFIVETRFKSKQQANETKLSSDLEAVDSKLQQERALHRELEVAKKQATEELDETTSRLENELKNLAVSLQSEERLAEKMDQFSGQMLLRLEHIKGSFIAVGDVRNSLEAYVQNLENRKQAVTALEEKCEREIAEAEKVKSQLQREELEVEEVFESEINEISGNMDTCAILAQHNKRYLSRLEQQLKQNQERIEIDTLNRADYEELKQRLEEEATMARNRVDTQERDMHALSANRRQLQDERDKKIGSMRADIQALADRIAVEAQSLREHQSKRSEIQGEVQILNAKLESNKSVMLELKLTRERISQLLTDLKNQRRSGEQLVDALKAQETQLQEELSGAKERLKKELDDINFRLDVQDKAISGLTGFQKKVWADLEYIRSKLLSTEHVLLELEETIKRIGMMLDAAVQRHDLQQQVRKRSCAIEWTEHFTFCRVCYASYPIVLSAGH
jgi:DNA repair exonuclease SbcCD ATPase subunit